MQLVARKKTPNDSFDCDKDKKRNFLDTPKNIPFVFETIDFTEKCIDFCYEIQ